MKHKIWLEKDERTWNQDWSEFPVGAVLVLNEKKQRKRVKLVDYIVQKRYTPLVSKEHM